jgi:hypothetical protein
MKEFKIGLSLLVFVLLLLVLVINTNSSYPFRDEIDEEVNYEISEGLELYIDKFYRDLGNFGHFPKRPRNFKVVFSSLDSFENTSHVHGVSLGMNIDDKVEIYINQRSWDSFSKPKRYYLIYHELGHDILNLNDLSEDENNWGSIMYPSISKYSDLTMDDFIVNMKGLFESL